VQLHPNQGTSQSVSEPSNVTSGYKCDGESIFDVCYYGQPCFRFRATSAELSLICRRGSL